MKIQYMANVCSRALDVKGVDWRRAPRADITEGHDRLKLGSINEYSKSLILVDLTVRPERVRISALSGFRTGNVPSSESCSFSCELALSSNALNSRGLSERSGFDKRSWWTTYFRLEESSLSVTTTPFTEITSWRLDHSLWNLLGPLALDLSLTRTKSPGVKILSMAPRS